VKLLPLILLLAGCASTGDAPFCVIYEAGQPAKFLFQGSREQRLDFERNRDRGAIFKPRDWTQPAEVPAWRR
jgi:hypothetical protein